MIIQSRLVYYTYTYSINTVFKTTTLFNHSTLPYKVVQGHLVSLENKQAIILLQGMVDNGLELSCIFCILMKCQFYIYTTFLVRKYRVDNGCCNYYLDRFITIMIFLQPAKLHCLTNIQILFMVVFVNIRINSLRLHFKLP